MRQDGHAYRSLVDQALREHSLIEGEWADTTEAPKAPPADGEVPQPLRSAMAYSLLLPGKRLRPVLLLASYALLREDKTVIDMHTDSLLKMQMQVQINENMEV